ncbi:SIMPL domain-containing protein [Adhaeribacter sp. BT258]|uniref:SIMPL domain-containing protein n=1 Tax=Adhaeribacter terrigena TaxID=2793070 RepID=A0ABS1C585_9BACT|nr:SIMPL domain-containing protein [Adhaeribacter terrigena]MBK0403818.1 SIMPL domain-containing protein [Adhaeribacter terrigena]
MYKIPVFVALLALASCQANEGRIDSRHKTIMIKAAGEVETVPDMATFRIHLSCLKPTIGASKQCLVDKSNALHKKLLNFNLYPKDILTTSVDLQKGYEWRNNSRVFTGYNSATTLIVTVKNLDNLDRIYTELIENQNLEIGNLVYSHSKLDSLKNEAYLKALRNSKVLADRLLTELPEKKKEILKIGNVAISASLPEPRDAAQQDYAVYEQAATVGVAAQANRSISVSRGTVLVNADLFVEYLIK